MKAIVDRTPDEVQETENKIKITYRIGFMSISIKLNPSLSLQEGLKIPMSWAKSLPSYDINVLAILRLQNLTHQFFETTGLLLQRFVYILQGKKGKMEKNGKKITQLK